jgi:hypothetical protein
MRIPRPINRTAQPPEPPEMTILSIRLECRSHEALSAVVEVLQGAMGTAESISRSYANHSDGGKRVYIKFIVPDSGTMKGKQ